LFLLQRLTAEAFTATLFVLKRRRKTWCSVSCLVARVQRVCGRALSSSRRSVTLFMQRTTAWRRTGRSSQQKARREGYNLLYVPSHS